MPISGSSYSLLAALRIFSVATVGHPFEAIPDSEQQILFEISLRHDAQKGAFGVFFSSFSVSPSLGVFPRAESSQSVSSKRLSDHCFFSLLYFMISEISS